MFCHYKNFFFFTYKNFKFLLNWINLKAIKVRFLYKLLWKNSKQSYKCFILFFQQNNKKKQIVKLKILNFAWFFW